MKESFVPFWSVGQLSSSSMKQSSQEELVIFPLLFQRLGLHNPDSGVKLLL
jgi:hypothetical protein